MNKQETPPEAKEAKIKHFTYFPTRIFSLEVPDPENLNRELLQHIHSARDADQKGIQRSNFRSLGGWHSKNFLHRDERFSKLVEHVGQLGADVSSSCGYDQDYRLKIGTMWSIINPPGSSNRAHVHPGCLWSGVYYVQAPENSGNISFTDPRTQNIMAQPRYMPNVKRPKSSWTKVNFKPVSGKMLIFPSWLFHAVDPNLSTEKGEAAERVIISFNLSQAKVNTG